MAHSETFGALLRDIVGNTSGRAFGKRIGVSETYGVAILKGSVPSEEVLTVIAEEYGLDDALNVRLFAAAKETRPDIAPERMIQTACAAAPGAQQDRHNNDIRASG